MRIRSLIVCCLLLVCSFVAVSAQDAPPGVFEAAVKAANTALPGLGQPSGGWTWQRLAPTTLSSLGCPLVQGTDLGREVTPYSAILSYTGGQYVVYVTADSTLTQPCDSKFGTLVASTPAPPSGCQIASAAQPTFRIAPDSSTAILGGEVMVNGVAYAIGRTDTKDWYQTRNKANQVGWVSAKEITLSGACDSLPITGAQNIDYVTSPCFLTAAQDFSNVRQLPSTNAPILARVFENSYWQVYATTTDGQWLFINPGWVADRVAEKYGVCNQLAVNNSLVGVIPGTPTPTPAVSATPVSVIVGTPVAAATVAPVVVSSNCPADFKGFLTPRISMATGARVATGGAPNRLRGEPNVGSLQIGEAQPSRTLGLLSGPMCSDTYVWWFVEIDGVKGWTVESDSSSNAYFLDPLQAPVAAPTAQPITIAVATAAPTSVAQPAGNVPGLLQSTSFSGPATDIRVVNGNVIALVPSGSASSVYQWRLDALTAAPVILKDNVSGWDVTPKRLILVDSNGALSAYDTTTLASTPIQGGPLSYSVAPDFNSDGRYLLTAGCNDDACTKGKIDLWSVETSTVIRSQPAHVGGVWHSWFTPDDRHILSMGNDGFQVWDTQSGAFVNGVSLNIVVGMPIIWPVITSDSSASYLAYCVLDATQGCDNAKITGWTLADGKVIADFPVSATSYPLAFAMSPNDQVLAVALSGGTIQLWRKDASETFVQGQVLPSDKMIYGLAFSADGTKLVSGGNNSAPYMSFEPTAGDDQGLIQVWDVSQP